MGNNAYQSKERLGNVVEKNTERMMLETGSGKPGEYYPGKDGEENDIQNPRQKKEENSNETHR
jgi:hypothetical protein